MKTEFEMIVYMNVEYWKEEKRTLMLVVTLEKSFSFLFVV